MTRNITNLLRPELLAHKKIAHPALPIARTGPFVPRLSILSLFKLAVNDRVFPAHPLARICQALEPAHARGRDSGYWRVTVRTSHRHFQSVNGV